MDFGYYERRTDSATGTIGGSIGAGGVVGTQTLAVDLTQTARTGGGIGGVDVTLRNLFSGNDGLIVGVPGRVYLDLISP